MSQRMTRRSVLKTLGAGTVVLLGVSPTRAAAPGDRLVVAVGQWGIETPFAWCSSQSEKTLWDCVYDPLIMRDPTTFAYQPGLATAWQPAADYKSWTFQLPVFSANTPPGHAHETGRKSLPGAGLRADGGG
jgi:ABC-type transport system substrate-binding protein